MKVLLASPRGFCAGVERAIEIVDRALEAFGPPVYVRKEIVHNRFVVEDLKSRGALFVDELAEVPEHSIVVFSAHGVSPAVREDAKSRHLKTIDATCPLVTKVHLEVARFLNAGCELILVGHAGHDEVVGTMGEAPDRIRLVTSVGDAARVEVANPAKLVVLTQTTLSTDDSAEIMAELRKRFPNLSLPPSEDICYATRSRQQAVKVLAKSAPVIIVVGAQNSSNSIRLKEVARSLGATAHLINHVGEVDWRWLKGIETVGITAGASAPERVVRELINTILFRYGGGLEEVSSAPETTRFFLPPELEEALKARRPRTAAREAVASRKD
jgi:4-hydroxy-3-methylbut-2-enyl diphosphate reductase